MPTRTNTTRRARRKNESSSRVAPYLRFCTVVRTAKKYRGVQRRLLDRRLKIFGSALLQPARSVFVSFERFFICFEERYTRVNVW